MPTIAFSDNFMSGSSGTTMGRLMSFGASTGCLNPAAAANLGLLSIGSQCGNAGYYRGGLISIMKGTVPTNFTSLTGWNSRGSDALVSWTASANLSGTSANTNPAVINSSFVSATASGTATWFWWVTRGQEFGFDNTLFEQIIGTVGVTGSGADLEISSTSITAGQLFRVIDLRLQLATSFNY